MAIKNEESQQPNNSPLSQTRRSALKKMLVGTGVAAGATALPNKWAKPIVDKVLVPAHAQTSCPELPANYRGEITIEGEEDLKLSLWDTLKEAVIPSAHAGFSPHQGTAELCIGVNCDPATGKITFESVLSIYNEWEGYYFTGTGEVGGPTVAMTTESICVSEASIQVTAVDPDKAQFSIVIVVPPGGGQFSSSTSEIGPGTGCPEPPPNIFCDE